MARGAWRSLREVGAGAAYRAAAQLAGLLPRPWAVALGSRGGELAWLFQGRRRRVLRENWRRTRGDARVLGSPRRAYRRFGEEWVETLRLLHASEPEIDRRVHFLGLEPVARAAASPGVLLLSLHSGNWEWAGAALARHGGPVRALARRHPGPVDGVFQSARRRFGVRTAGRASELRSGRGFVAFFLDRELAAAGADPDRQARRAVALAARRGWAVAACWIERQAGETYAVQFGTPLWPGASRAERCRAAQTALSFLRARAARRPEEWFAFEPLVGLPPGRTA